MELVLDNSSLFSIMNPKSTAAYLFSSIRAKFIAPNFIKEEFDKYKDECLFKSGLTEQQFEMRQKEVEESIEFFEGSRYDEFLIKAINNLSDPKDSPYLALALLRDSAIWSDDPDFQEQSLVPVYTTKDLAEMFLNNEI